MAILTKESLAYLPCVMSSSGRIDKPVCNELMTRGAAEHFLIKNHYNKWVRCEALPKLINNWDKLK
jgi:hypothetical protein